MFSSIVLSGFGATTPCTANQASAESMMNEWVKLWDEALRYPTLAKAVKDELWQAFQAADAWYANAFGSGGVWCATKEDFAGYKATLDRAKGALSVAVQGLTRVEAAPSKPGSTITLPEEQIFASAGWWGLTLGVLALSAVALASRRRRQAAFGNVRVFRYRYRKGLR